MIIKILGKPSCVIGLLIILVMVTVALFAPLIAPNDPNELNPLEKHAQASAKYPLGTDQLGRCEFSRLIYGASYSLGISLPALGIISVIALILGGFCSYKTGIFDKVVMAVCNVLMAFPAFMIAIALIGSLGNDIGFLILSVAISMLAWFVKMARSYCMLEANKDYITGAKISGASEFSIVFRHIIPNALPTFFVYALNGVAMMILMISGFSFLGLGLPPGTPEWGAMLNDAQVAIYSNPMLIIYPGIFVLVTAGGFTLFAESLRDIIAAEDKTV